MFYRQYNYLPTATASPQKIVGRAKRREALERLECPSAKLRANHAGQNNAGERLIFANIRINYSLAVLLARVTGPGYWSGLLSLKIV